MTATPSGTVLRGRVCLCFGRAARLSFSPTFNPCGSCSTRVTLCGGHYRGSVCEGIVTSRHTVLTEPPSHRGHWGDGSLQCGPRVDLPQLCLIPPSSQGCSHVECLCSITHGGGDTPESRSKEAKAGLWWGGGGAGWTPLGSPLPAVLGSPESFSFYHSGLRGSRGGGFGAGF